MLRSGIRNSEYRLINLDSLFVKDKSMRWCSFFTNTVIQMN
jgi:hypothetical protein